MSALVDQTAPTAASAAVATNNSNNLSVPSQSSSTPEPPASPSSKPPRRLSSTQQRRPRAASSVTGQPGGGSALATHEDGLNAIRKFLRDRSSYDVFPVSFRLIVLDSKLMVKKALGVMLQNGVISAPLWNSETSSFAGMLTVFDIIHLIQYYYHTQTYEGAVQDVETFRLENLRQIEKELHVPPPPLLSVHPMKPLLEAAKLLQATHARRLPLIDIDESTGNEVVLSVLTQYRVLKFIAVNCMSLTPLLSKSLRACNIGCYVAPEHQRPKGPVSLFWPVLTATLQTKVFDVVHMFSERGVSAVPIVDDDGVVLNLYETVDVITLIRSGLYTSLDLTIAEALERRAPDFSGVVSCTQDDSLANLFELIRKRRVHRLVVVEAEDLPPSDGFAKGKKRGRLVGIISLSDVLKCVITEPVAMGTPSLVPEETTTPDGSPPFLNKPELEAEDGIPLPPPSIAEDGTTPISTEPLLVNPSGTAVEPVVTDPQPPPPAGADHVGDYAEKLETVGEAAS